MRPSGPPTDDQEIELSSQTIAERPAIQRTISLRLDPRLVAMLGAGLLVLAGFLPWIDQNTQMLLIDRSIVAPVIAGWSSLSLGVIALGVLALTRTDPKSTWVSLPAAVLGLAAIFIAIVSAISTANVVTVIINSFSINNAVTYVVPGAGILITIMGGILCVVAGLSHPAEASTESHLDMRVGQPRFMVFVSAMILIALLGGLVGAWLASSRAEPIDEDASGFPTELLGTPVLDVQVTPLGPTVDLDLVPPAEVPTEPPPLPSPIVPNVTPVSTPNLSPTALIPATTSTTQPTSGSISTSTPSATPASLTPSPTSITSPLSRPTTES